MDFKRLSRILIRVGALGMAVCVVWAFLCLKSIGNIRGPYGAGGGLVNLAYFIVNGIDYPGSAYSSAPFLIFSGMLAAGLIIKYSLSHPSPSAK